MTVLTPTEPDLADAGPEAPVTDPRIEARRRAVRAATVRRVRAALVVLVSLAALGLVGGAVLISPLLDIDRVTVLGAPDLDGDRLVRASGVRVGQATYSVDAEAAAARVAALPEVAAATARVRWPGELEVRVTPRRLVARVVGRDDVVMTIGRGGVVVDESAILPEALAEVRVPDLGPVRTGRRLPEPFRSAVEAVGTLPLSVRLRISGATVDADGRILLDRTDGGTILVGTPEGIDAKVRSIEIMLGGRIDVERLCLLDVRDPQAPVVRRDPDCRPPAPEPVPEAAPGIAAPEAPTEPSPTDVGGTPPVAPGPSVVPPAWGSPGRPEVDLSEPDVEVEGT